MSNVSEEIRESFDGTAEVDLNSVISEFPFGDDNPGKLIPVKKLSEEFDGCVRPDDFMKVFLRIRPIKSNMESTMSVESDTSILTNAPDNSKRAIYTKTEQRNYAFSKVYGPEVNQEEVYKTTASPLLQRLCNGENSVLFAYGMTNAGKTYTIQGNQTSAPGILPRLITDILGSRSSKPGVKYSMSISMLEIYQDKVYDLLSTSKKNLSIRDGNGNVEVAKLTTHSISMAKEAVKLMDIASAKRHKSSTGLNTVSSRSHAVYTLSLEQTSIATGQEISTSAFYLVDLAGAERGNRTKGTAVQQQEANSINRSLSTLWWCLQGMRKSKGSLNDNGSSDIIPFRESKLTHLLVPILGRAGVGGVAMIACVNPQVEDYDETLSVLGNASLAMKIKEITDLGRTTGSQQLSSQSLEEPQQSSRSSVTAVSKSASVEMSKAEVLKGAGKRKRVETGSIIVKSLASSINGLLGKKSRHASTSSNVKTGVSSKTAKEIAKEAKEKNQAAVASTESSEREDAMRLEIEALKQANSSLITQQGRMETEIRLEIAKEMQRSSAELLDQIQDLRSQLSSYECNTREDILLKSTKKIRKKQRTYVQEEAQRGLEEAEEELERVKTTYEDELNALRIEKDSLQATLENVMESTASATSSSSALILSTSKSQNMEIENRPVEATVQAHKPSPIILENLQEKNNKEKRLSRQMRSPLSPITNGNIIMDLTNASPFDKTSGVKGTSPVKGNFREAYQNAAAAISFAQPSPVFTRLRSRACKQ